MGDGTTQRFVSLLRVSTTNQGGDGNGIHAQRRDIELFLKQQGDAVVVQEFIESGLAQTINAQCWTLLWLRVV